MGFKNLEEAYDRINREAVWQVLRIYDVGGRIDSGERRECIISPWLFNVNMEAVMKELKMGKGGGERVDIAWPPVCRLLGFLWRVGGRLNGNEGTFY